MRNKLNFGDKIYFVRFFNIGIRTPGKGKLFRCPFHRTITLLFLVNPYIVTYGNTNMSFNNMGRGWWPVRHSVDSAASTAFHWLSTNCKRVNFRFGVADAITAAGTFNILFSSLFFEIPFQVNYSPRTMLLQLGGKLDLFSTKTSYVFGF